MTENRTENLICWMDIETNGSRLKSYGWDARPWILEVGAIMTDWNLTPVGHEFHMLFPLPDDYNLKDIPEIVYRMHDESGLWNDLQEEKEIHPHWSFDKVDEDLWNWHAYTTYNYDRDVKELETTHVYLAGSGVSHYDSRWIQHFFPGFWSCIKGFDNETKPTLDLGVTRRLLEVFGLPHLIAPDFSEDHSLTPHRALDDVKNFIAQAQWYRDTFTGFYDLAQKNDDGSLYLHP